MNFPGHILKEKRENLGFSHQDITDNLSISSDILMTLENGDLSRFPDSSYVIGFLRSYCNFLGIDAEMMIADFKKIWNSYQVQYSHSDHSTFQFQIPKLRLPSFSIALPTELVGWISITALIVLGWVAYSTFAPSNDPADSNATEATSVDLRVPDLRSSRIVR